MWKRKELVPKLWCKLQSGDRSSHSWGQLLSIADLRKLKKSCTRQNGFQSLIYLFKETKCKVDSDFLLIQWGYSSTFHNVSHKRWIKFDYWLFLFQKVQLSIFKLIAMKSSKRHFVWYLAHPDQSVLERKFTLNSLL